MYDCILNVHCFFLSLWLVWTKVSRNKKKKKKEKKRKKKQRIAFRKRFAPIPKQLNCCFVLFFLFFFFSLLPSDSIGLAEVSVANVCLLMKLLEFLELGTWLRETCKRKVRGIANAGKMKVIGAFERGQFLLVDVRSRRSTESGTMVAINFALLKQETKVLAP